MPREGWIRCLAAAAVLMAACAAGGCGKSSDATPPTTTTATPSETTAANATMPATSDAAAPARRRVNVFISGHVQGVGFRAFTEDEARRLGLVGWVMNLPDGRVEAMVEGPSAKVDSLLERLRQGSRGSRVDAVEFSEQGAKWDFTSFEVRP